jgi:hypothetical protein
MRLAGRDDPQAGRAEPRPGELVKGIPCQPKAMGFVPFIGGCIVTPGDVAVVILLEVPASAGAHSNASVRSPAHDRPGKACPREPAWHTLTDYSSPLSGSNTVGMAG